MFARALVAFLVLPGVAAFAAPPVIAGWDPWPLGGSLLGLPVMAVGALVLLWCVRDFYVAGKGTLAPWSPPQNMVVVGLYRYCRNPMYVGVLTLVLGWALVLGSSLAALYGLVLGIAFHVRVLVHEEPWLRSQFPEQWEDYRERVPRWVPRWPRKGSRRETGL